MEFTFIWYWAVAGLALTVVGMYLIGQGQFRRRRWAWAGVPIYTAGAVFAGFAVVQEWVFILAFMVPVGLIFASTVWMGIRQGLRLRER